MTVAYSARSHIGRVRDKNQDNLFAGGVTLTAEISDRTFTLDGNAVTPLVLAVCDGMGGEENGEAASMIAVRKLSDISEMIKNCPLREMSRTVQNYVNAVHAEIHSSFGSIGKRVGTTLALAVISDGRVLCFNVGDTRVYRLANGALTQITNDHSAVTESGKRKLTRCVGIGESYTAESYPAVHGKCRLLICSDGLTDMLPTPEIEKTLKDTLFTSDAAGSLVELALEKGGRDNITVIVADVPAKTAFIGCIVNKLRKWRGL
jgi:protein phosphatase